MRLKMGSNLASALLVVSLQITSAETARADSAQQQPPAGQDAPPATSAGMPSPEATAASGPTEGTAGETRVTATLQGAEGGPTAAPGPLAPPPGPTPAEAPPAMQRRPGLMAAGISLSAVGLFTGGLGAIALGTCAGAPSRADRAGGDASGSQGREGGCLTGLSWGLVIGGTAAMAVGVPLLVIGARKVPVQAAQGAATLLVGPGSVGVRVTM
ncbi:hypothetical protein [Chondromyces crocatus]|uniref:Uncharacterized protein n=1 Tax=Chondromyces crocatus TaxID=52 RepID=A0A0K1EMK2_CHOCO|nr:hypothetical protein [Chondromyces crocatus]AKT42130.1 uncharacterized protein CMC5_063530 [Chondromyces crocatus]